MDCIAVFWRPRPRRASRSAGDLSRHDASRTHSRQSMARSGIGPGIGLRERKMAAPAGNRWQRIEETFYAALEHAPPDRDAFLDQACGDDLALRNEVQSLLDASDKTLSFLEKPVQQAARNLGETGDRHLGSYRLLRVL